MSKEEIIAMSDLKRLRMHKDNKTKQAMQQDCQWAADRIEALEVALRFYAEEHRYNYDNDCCAERDNPGHDVYEDGILGDRGNKARAALAKQE